jgi:hypothetical protein
VDWDAGTVKRPRSKTRGQGGPVVTYKLGPRTRNLLRKFRSREEVLNKDGKPRVPLSEDGNPLVRFWLARDGGESGDKKLRRYDVIQSAYRRLLERVRFRRPIESIRKTSSTLLGNHESYRWFAQYFLAESPRTVADRHYVVPSDEQFSEALDWLRQQYGL